MVGALLGGLFYLLESNRSGFKGEMVIRKCNDRRKWAFESYWLGESLAWVGGEAFGIVSAVSLLVGGFGV